MTKRRTISRKEERAEAAKASAPSIAMPAGSRRWVFDPNSGYSLPVVHEHEAREVLARAMAQRELSGDSALIDGIAARIADYPSDICERYSELMFAIMRRLGGDDIFERLAAKSAEPPPPSQADVLAQQAQEVAQSIGTLVHVLGGQRQFQKASGQPKQSALARELFRRGYAMDEILTAGFNRGTAADARNVVRAEYIKAGKQLTKNLQISAGSARRGGDDRRIGRGTVADENREASRLVAIAAPVLVKPSVKARRKGVAQQIEAFAAQALKGTYDEGNDADEET